MSGLFGVCIFPGLKFLLESNQFTSGDSSRVNLSKKQHKPTDNSCMSYQTRPNPIYLSLGTDIPGAYEFSFLR